MKDDFKALEDILDAKVAGLEIWKLPFQTIMSYLFGCIENIDLKGRVDTAMDYTSRLAYLYPLVKQKSLNAPVVSTTDAISGYDMSQYTDDVNFLNAYAHCSMLMPQFHRETMIVTSKEETNYTLEFPSPDVAEAEIIDRVLSYISLQMVVSFPGADELNAYLSLKIDNGSHAIEGMDFFWMKSLFDFLKKTLFNVKVLPDSVFETEIGVSYNEYYSFCAAMRACAEFFVALGRAYYAKVDFGNPKATDNNLMAEYMEWTICSLNHKTLGWIQGLSGLSSDKFRRILSYYLDIYSDTTTEGFYSVAHCGDGYFPPVIWQEGSILFSPHGFRYMLTANNILYSINKREANRFSQQISHHLEPSLISQLEYIFTSVPGVQIRKNINYALSEVDMMIMKESENVVISVQVKATIAPDSARTVERVEGRAQEGMKQIALFESLHIADQESIINNVFGTKLKGIKIIHILVVRSSAGGAGAWTQNKKYPIANYGLLGWLLAGKKEKGDGSLLNFDQEIRNAQKELVDLSVSNIKTETLKIGEHSISFPNVESENSFIMKVYTKILRNFPDFEQVFIA